MPLSSAIQTLIKNLEHRYPTKRALVLPVLRAIQHEQGYISLEAEKDVASALKIPLVWVHEVVTFYTQLYQSPNGKYHIQVCTSVACQMSGAEKLLALAREASGETMSVEEVECLCACGTPGAVQINDEYYENLTESKFNILLKQCAAGNLPETGRTFPWVDTSALVEPILTKRFSEKGTVSIQQYLDTGGYKGLQKALSLSPDDVIEEVKRSNLRGRGGAGFPAGMKWSFVPKDPDQPKYVVINADESEPFTFKDRYIIEKDPHLVLEGALIAAYAVQAKHVYIYMRGEFAFLEPILQRAIAEAYEQNFAGQSVAGKKFQCEITLHMGAGAYICGEETGLLESLEGKKGQPRLKPPFPAIVGAFGYPTVINNVETVSSLPAVFTLGAEKFAGIGCEKNGGTKLFSVSGDVGRRGVYELPNGIPLRELIEKHAQGVQGELQGVVPGGASSPILLPSEIDLPMDFDSVKKANSMLGSAGVMVFNRKRCMVQVLKRLMHFYHHESCGQCSPCREGTGWAETVVGHIVEGKGNEGDLETLRYMARNMSLGMTICPMGDAAALPLSSYTEKFREIFEAHIQKGGCKGAHAKD